MAAEVQIKIPILIWASMVKELRRRGRGKRESGAFLLGYADRADNRVIRYVCFDDLDPHALVDGAIEFHDEGYSALWDLCRAERLKVLADVHTHPSASVRQSGIDAANPMLATIGHVGIILPYFGRKSRQSLAGVGVYRFRGRKKWDSWFGAHPENPVRLSLW